MNTKGYFIIGTDTDIGKTYVSSRIVKYFKDKNINTGYYKAALSGMEKVDNELVPHDAKYVCDYAGITKSPKDFVSYSYVEEVSPHLAARRIGEQIHMSKIKCDFEKICNEYDMVIAEGSGGILCPIYLDDIEPLMLEDIVRLTEFPVILVADAGLGTINHTLLTINYLNQKDFKIAAVILNRYDENNFMHKDNKEVIEKFSNVKLFTLPYQV